METKKAPLSIRVIYWITNVLFWIVMFLSFTLIASNILLFSGVIKGNKLSNKDVEVKVNISNAKKSQMNNLDLKLKFVNTANFLDFINPNDFFAKKVAPLLLIYFLVSTYLIWIIRKFLKNVNKGETFTIENIGLLKRISYVLVCYWILLFVSTQLARYYITGHLEIYKNFLFNNLILWDALFLWVLAHIFITGLKLKQEKDLTI